MKYKGSSTLSYYEWVIVINFGNRNVYEIIASHV